jgi:hypothetical protein
MKQPVKNPMDVDQAFSLLEEFYKRGVTRKEMKELIDIWWRVSKALGRIQP